MSTPEGTENYYSIGILLAHPLSRGSVHVASASLDAKLDINPKYLSHPLDIEVLSRHLSFVDKLVGAEPIASHLKEEKVARVPRALMRHGITFEKLQLERIITQELVQ